MDSEDLSSVSGISMYLSFDAESTMPTAAYKTLENMTDAEDGLNKTLEGENPTTTQMNSIKHLTEIHNRVQPSPLRSNSLNVLKQYNVMCSTPTKDQLVKSVQVERGSFLSECIDFGLEIKGIDEEKSSEKYLHSIPEENKENTHHDLGEGSTLSSSSVETVNSIIEKKVVISSSIIEVIKDEIPQLSDNILQTEIAGKSIAEDRSIQTPTLDKEIEDSDITPKVEIRIEPNSAEKYSNGPKVKIPSKRSIIAPKQYRKSICEPDLVSNRPSRIQVGLKKSTPIIAMTRKLIIDEKDEVNIIPNLINKMLKITTSENEKLEKPIVVENKRKSIAFCGTSKGRSSLMPIVQAEKRTYQFANRKTIVYNSPARKIVRKSIVNINSPLAAVQKMARLTSSRKSMLPVHTVKSTNVQESSQNLAGNCGRKSVFPIQKQSSNDISTDKKMEGTKMRNIVTSTDSNLTCKTCSATFRFKSLFEAHKRAHTDDIPPIPVRKLSSASQQSTNSVVSLGSINNQCKYCDKKFALLRALHIHLLQNCPKIPPAEKRKLHYTELDHVEKAPLPVHTETNGKNVSHTKNCSKVMTSSTESITDKSSSIMTNGDKMLAPVSTKVKKKPAHSGVYRTPTKHVICHKCKIAFKSIMEHIEHNLKMHPTTPLTTDQTKKFIDDKSDTDSKNSLKTSKT